MCYLISHLLALQVNNSLHFGPPSKLTLIRTS